MALPQATVDCTPRKSSSDEDSLCRLETHQRPVVYHPQYNVSVYGFERLHPFDTHKWKRIIDFLKEEKLITNATLVEPTLPSLEELSKVHDRRCVCRFHVMTLISC